MKISGLLAVGVVLLASGWACAAEISVYPGAQMEKAEMKSAQEAQAKLPVKVRQSLGTSQIYTTADGFEAVYDYYKKRYAETDLNLKKTKVKIATGQVVHDAYFCLDNAKSINESKHFLKIENPRPAIYKVAVPGKHLPKIPERTLIQFTEKK